MGRPRLRVWLQPEPHRPAFKTSPNSWTETLAEKLPWVPFPPPSDVITIITSRIFFSFVCGEAHLTFTYEISDTLWTFSHVSLWPCNSPTNRKLFFPSIPGLRNPVSTVPPIKRTGEGGQGQPRLSAVPLGPTRFHLYLAIYSISTLLWCCETVMIINIISSNPSQMYSGPLHIYKCLLPF